MSANLHSTVTGILIMAMAATTAAAGGCTHSPKTYNVYIGSSSGGPEGGVYRFEFDNETGETSDAVQVAANDMSLFLTIHPNGRFLYNVGQFPGKQGVESGAVTAYAIYEQTGGLTKLNSEAAHGAVPCHIVVDPTEQNVLLANYITGNVAVLPIDESGRLSPATSVVQQHGSGPNPRRQEGPHAHSINLDPSGRIAVAADLGADKLFLYAFDADKGTLTPGDPAAVEVPPGGGPRHFTFHPNTRFAYTNNELTSTVTAMTWDARSATLTPVQTIPTLPQSDPRNTTAEILVHPNGRFLYVSNRGHDSIAIFKIDPASGTLTILDYEPTLGRVPRNFVLSPDGRWLIVTNQQSNSVVVFRVDPTTGGLTATDRRLSVPAPICVRFNIGAAG